MTALHGLDLLAMGIYFIVLIGIGLRVARSEKEGGDSESFLAADRNMNLVQTTASTAATDIGGGFTIATGGLGFTVGIAGSWFIAISGLSIIIVSFFMVPKVKRWADAVKGLTTGDLFEARFDRRTGTIAAVVIGLAWFTFVGGQIIAGAKLVQVTMGVDLTLAVIASGAIVLAYTAMGGLKAVIFTDVFQMVILMVGIVFIAVPIGLIEVGGWQGIVTHFESDPETASMVDWGAAGWGTIAEWFFAVFPVWFISIAGMQRIIAARDEKTARRSFLLTGVPIEWPLFAIGSTLIGMIARMLLPEITDPEMATPMIILELLPSGIAGIVIAAYVAAVMSSADSMLMGPVVIFVNDIYRKRLKPEASDRELVRVARIAVIVFGILAIGLAYRVPNVLELILYAYTFGAAGLFFPMLGLLFWRRTTAKGAYWSMLCGGGSAVIWSLAGEPFGMASSYMGWIIGLPVMVIVSLLTDHSPDENTTLFYSE